MKRIAVFTGGRSDYGHLFWVIKCMDNSKVLHQQIIIPFNHPNIMDIITFSTQGKSMIKYVNEIYETNQYGNIYADCLQILNEIKPDIFLCLGDRWETHAAATAALLSNIPIAHIHGGESTEGAFDNNLRNSITMMADYHFTSHEEYAENIARMIGLCRNWNRCEYLINTSGELLINELWNKIFVVGSPGLDWLIKAKLYTKAELKNKVSIDLNKSYILACFNPVTKELPETEKHMKNFLSALSQIYEQIILIHPNFDPKNEVIKQYENTLAKEFNKKWMITDNIDHLTYLSLMKYAIMMIGNSSSGIIEAPSFGLPAVDIGNRQKGRITGDNVIHCGYETEDILEAIQKAKIHSVHRDYDWENDIVNSYGDGHSAEKIVKILEEIC